MSESRQEAAFRNAGFFAIQLDFARRMAAGRGLALGEAVAAYTCLRRRLSLSEDDPSTKLPWTAQGYYRNIEWWAENRTRVNAYWSKWIIQ